MRFVLLFLLSFSVYGDEVRDDLDRFQDRFQRQEIERRAQDRAAWDQVKRDARELDRKMERSRPCYSWQRRCD